MKVKMLRIANYCQTESIVRCWPGRFSRLADVANRQLYQILLPYQKIIISIIITYRCNALTNKSFTLKRHSFLQPRSSGLVPTRIPPRPENGSPTRMRRWKLGGLSPYSSTKKACSTYAVESRSLSRVYLMVDALDECDSDKFRLLDLIANSSSRSSKVNWLVSSRNEPDIEERLRMANSLAAISLESNSYYVSRPVDAFINSRIAKLAQLKGYREEMCGKIRSSLSAKADETFLWVALVCKEVETTRCLSLKNFHPGFSR